MPGEGCETSTTEALIDQDSYDEVDGHEMISQQKVLVVGDGGCGKTSLLSVFQTGDFPEEHFPTIFETAIVDLELKGRSIPLELWDTAGQEDYDRLRPLFYPDTDVILICFSLANRDSFVNVVDRWVPEVRYFCPRVPIVLVGTKSDLRDQADRSTRVDESEAKAVAEDISAVDYVECSAKRGHCVREVFVSAAMAALRKHRLFKQCVVM